MAAIAILERPVLQKPDLKVVGGKRPPPASTVKDAEIKTWFSSDRHVLHKNIFDYCPGRQALGKDYREATEEIIRRHNETVGVDDIVYIIGDECLGPIDESLELASKMHGKKRLIPGNHDRCWSFAKAKGNRDWKKAYEDAGFEIWPEQSMIMVGPHYVLLCHFPYRGDSHGSEDRFRHARPFDEGRVLLCGHVHDAWKISGKQINVGCDVWDYKPVEESVILHTIEGVLG